jgi:hypothetical protein
MLHNKSLGSHICHKCNYPWGEDCALRALYQVFANNPRVDANYIGSKEARVLIPKVHITGKINIRMEKKH